MVLDEEMSEVKTAAGSVSGEGLYSGSVCTPLPCLEKDRRFPGACPHHLPRASLLKATHLGFPVSV